MSGIKKKRNPKIIALIIEGSVFIVGVIFILVFHYGLGRDLNMIPIIIITGIWILAFILTLSLIRYDVVREIRSEGHYVDKDNKKVFLSIYEDKTTMICHDLKEENQEEKNKD